MILYNKIHFLLRDHNVNTSFYKLVLCHPANKKGVFFSVFVNIHEAMNIFNLLTNFYKKQSFEGVLRHFAKFTGKHLCQSLHFNKAAGLRPATLLKKRLWHRYFSVNFEKFLRAPFLQNTSGQLLLLLHYFTV